MMPRHTSADFDDELHQLRRQVDLLDEDIALLLQQRFEISRQIGHLKRARQLSIEDARREILVLTRVAELVQGSALREPVLKVYTTILAESRDIQSIE